jgi:hypothetical protein
MRTIALAVLLLAVTFSTVFAQNYRLEFYADEALTSCDLAVTGPGLVKVHMLITGEGNLWGISFKAVKPPCMQNASWIADVWQQAGLVGNNGNTQATRGEGVDVAFDCVPLPRYIGWIWFSVTGPIPACCAYSPQHGSYSGDVGFPGNMEILLCGPGLPVPMGGRGVVINPDATCACNLPLPTKQTTWGAVKDLYR